LYLVYIYPFTTILSYNVTLALEDNVTIYLLGSNIFSSETVAIYVNVIKLYSSLKPPVTVVVLS
jgi:hypothetical protein